MPLINDMRFLRSFSSLMTAPAPLSVRTLYFLSRIAIEILLQVKECFVLSLPSSVKMSHQAVAAKAQSFGCALHSTSSSLARSFNATTLGPSGPLSEGFATSQHAEFERYDDVAFVCDGPQDRMLCGDVDVGGVGG